MLKSAIVPALLVGTIGCFTSAQAAEISVLDLGEETGFATLTGEISSGDAASFAAATKPFRHVILVLDSPGGNLVEGLEIGRAVHERAMATGVGPGMVCASACALIWAAGNYKAMAPSSLIGFHAAWEDLDGKAVPSAVGNALVGGYLQAIGFTEAGIIFATSAGPDGISWMTIEDAREAGLDVRLMDQSGAILERSGPNTAEPEMLPLKLPTGYRWIVLASAKTVSDLRKNGAIGLPADLIKTVETETGYVAMVAGPYRREDAERIVKNARGIPADAYLSSGNGFLRLAR